MYQCQPTWCFPVICLANLQLGNRRIAPEQNCKKVRLSKGYESLGGLVGLEPPAGARKNIPPCGCNSVWVHFQWNPPTPLPPKILEKLRRMECFCSPAGALTLRGAIIVEINYLNLVLSLYYHSLSLNAFIDEIFLTRFW